MHIFILPPHINKMHTKICWYTFCIYQLDTSCTFVYKMCSYTVSVWVHSVAIIVLLRVK